MHHETRCVSDAQLQATSRPHRAAHRSEHLAGLQAYVQFLTQEAGRLRCEKRALQAEAAPLRASAQQQAKACLVLVQCWLCVSELLLLTGAGLQEVQQLTQQVEGHKAQCARLKASAEQQAEVEPLADSFRLAVD